MRTYGRIPDGSGGKTWVLVETDANGFNDQVYLTTLAQVIKLSRNESPFYANWGIPAQQSVIQQVFPDFYVAQTQQQFSGFFGALTIAKVASEDPYYRVNVTFHSGAKQRLDIPVPV